MAEKATRTRTSETPTGPSRFRSILAKIADFVCYLIYEKTLDEMSSEEEDEGPVRTDAETDPVSDDSDVEATDDDDSELVDVTEAVREGLFQKPSAEELHPNSPLRRYIGEEMNDSVRLYHLALLYEMLTGSRSDYELAACLPEDNRAYIEDLRLVYRRAFKTEAWTFWIVDATERVRGDEDLRRQIKETIIRGFSICQQVKTTRELKNLQCRCD